MEVGKAEGAETFEGEDGHRAAEKVRNEFAPNKTTKIQIQKYKYKNINTKIQIQKYKYKYTNTKIQIQKYGHRAAKKVRNKFVLN